MELRLSHVARLSMMGEMVAGIAHEINQPLYSVLNFAKAVRNILTEQQKPDVERLREWNDEIITAASHAGAIIKRLRSFARKGSAERSICPMNRIVKESLELTAFEARRRDVTVRQELSEPSASVHVDAVQIQQVLVNLLQNAFDAMEEVTANNRVVTVRSGRSEESDELVEVSVKDNGSGLPVEEHDNVFEAFVTTKPKGLGLGLTISEAIVESHGGRLWVTSAPEGGARFHFTLPIVEGKHSNGW